MSALAPSLAHADCSLSVDELGKRITKAEAAQTASTRQDGRGVSVEAMEEKMREATGDLRYGARGHDITENRLATASQDSQRETVPEADAAKSGVRHYDPAAGIVTPETSDPVLKAQSYWQQARELHALGKEEICLQAVEKGNAALDNAK